MTARSKPSRRVALAVSDDGVRAGGEGEALSDFNSTLTLEISQTATRAAEQATALESIGARAFEAAGILSRTASGLELLRKSHEVRGLVAHALGVLADLQFQAGRMQALAALRESAPDDGDDAAR